MGIRLTHTASGSPRLNPEPPWTARVFLIQGFYIVSYGLGIYLLNLLIGFLSPAVDPEIEEVLPTTESQEFRPFTRKLPEFKFWFAAIRAVLVATVLTFLPAFDLPVFWPILLAYFIVLVVLTMKDRVRHMFKYKYVPFSLGKQTYGECAKVEVPKGKEDK
ncbi:RER1A [Symbiodinium sp. CCMP2592]|nr:RER1A [Symbiodinium sp. CCMP2592]